MRNISKKDADYDKTKMWELFDLGKSFEFGYEPYSLDYQKALDCYMQCTKLLEFVADWPPTSVLLEKIGDFYYEGKGVQQDYGKALNWYSKALIYPNPSDTVYIRLGEMSERGEGSGIDVETAAKLYRSAIEIHGLHEASAQEHLSNLQEKGLLDELRDVDVIKKEQAFIQRDAKYQVLDVGTWIDTLKLVDPDSFTEADPMETMGYKEYLEQGFPADLQKYFGDGGLENVSDSWNGLLHHFLLFSTTLFNHLLCAQVICNLFGKRQMQEFLTATGMPDQFGNRSALVHPVRLFCNLGLIPHRNCISDYLAVFHDVSSGYDSELPIVLEKCSPADEAMSISEIKEELYKLRAYYEKWIMEPDAKCPRFYLNLRRMTVAMCQKPKT